MSDSDSRAKEEDAVAAAGTMMALAASSTLPLVDQDGFDQPADLNKQERRTFLDECYFRRQKLVDVALALLCGCTIEGRGGNTLLGRSHISSCAESILHLGIFLATHLDRSVAVALLTDPQQSVQYLPYICVLEYSVEEYSSELDAPSFRRFRKHCALLQTSTEVVQCERRLLSSMRRFAIARCWIADTRHWADYVLPGEGGRVARSTTLHHLDPDLCAIHHWIDDYDELDFDLLRNINRDDSAREQRDKAIHALLGIRIVKCSCEFLHKPHHRCKHDKVEVDATVTCSSPSALAVSFVSTTPTPTSPPPSSPVAPPVLSPVSSPLSARGSNSDSSGHSAHSIARRRQQWRRRRPQPKHTKRKASLIVTRARSRLLLHNKQAPKPKTPSPSPLSRKRQRPHTVAAAPHSRKRHSRLSEIKVM